MTAESVQPLTDAKGADASGIRLPGNLERLLLLVALFVTAAILLIGQSETSPVENREIRTFKVISAMTASGDYLVPMMDGKPRFNKPPLYYWIACGFSGMGLPDRIAYRLPSVLSAIGLILLVAWFCRRTEMPELAIPAALTLTALSLLYPNGRVANFDMILSVLSFATVGPFYMYVKHGKTGWLILSGFGFALALLAKATPAFVFGLAPIVIFLYMEGRLKLLARPSVIATLLLIPLAAGLTWVVASILTNDEAWMTFKNQAVLPFGVRSEHDTALHYKNFAFHFYNLPKTAFPAVILSPLCVMRAIRTRAYANLPLLRLSLISLAVILVIFSIIPQKQQNYMAGALPFIAILLADGITHGISEVKWQRFARILGWIMAATFLILAGLTAFYFFVIVADPVAGVFAPLGCLAFGGLLVYFTARNNLRGILLGGLCGWWFYLLLFYGSFNVWDTEFKSAEIFGKSYYNKEHWDSVLDRYPRLKNVFNTSSRFLKNEPKDEE